MARSAAGASPCLSAKALAQSPDPSYPAAARKPRRRRIRSAVFSGSAVAGGRRSGPATPLVRWKFDVGDRSADVMPDEGPKVRRKRHRTVAPAVSARRLAAVIWQLQLSEVGGGGGKGRTGRDGTEVRPLVSRSMACAVGFFLCSRVCISRPRVLVYMESDESWDF